MTILPVTPAKLRPFRVLSAVLSVAFVLAIAEVLAYGFTFELPLRVSQLALATFTNAAVIGSAAVALIVLAGIWIVLSVPAKTSFVQSCAACFPGVAADLAHSFACSGWRTSCGKWAQWLSAAISAWRFGLWRLGISLKPSWTCASGLIIACLACVTAAVASTHPRVYATERPSNPAASSG
jgi:hypothetical protein